MSSSELDLVTNTTVQFQLTDSFLTSNALVLNPELYFSIQTAPGVFFRFLFWLTIM